MKTKKITLVIIGTIATIAAVLLYSCTEQTRAKNLGGSMTLYLPAGQKLITATWKESNLWYLTEPMDSAYKPQEKILKESSNWGINEGTIIFKETK
jgi:hypothetical protein